MSAIRAGSHNEAPVVQVMDSLGTNRGGLTRSVFQRLRELATARDSVLITVAYQPNVREVFDELVEEGTVPATTRLVSFHESLRSATEGPVKYKRDDTLWNADASVAKIRESDYLTRYFRAGRFLGLVSKRRDGSISYIDVHFEDEPWRLHYRDRFWTDGSVGVREYFDANGAQRYRIYLARDSSPYMSTWVTPGGYEYRTCILWGDEPVLAKDMREANGRWLNSAMENLGEANVFADEPRTSFVFHSLPSRFKGIATIHTTHRASGTSPAPLKGWVKNYLAAKDNVDLWVTLTESQKVDLSNDLGLETERIRVIPHCLPTSDVHGPSRRRARFVTVSRLSKEKRIDHIIRAFSIALHQMPNICLDIFGTGSQKRDLQKLAKELGVGDSVHFRGHTTNARREFASATASLFASEFEGFGLTLIESMSVGTPVIGYASPYGPADMISLPHSLPVQNGSVEAFAKQIVDFSSMEDHSVARAAAVKFASEFGIDRWRKDWNSVII